MDAVGDDWFTVLELYSLFEITTTVQEALLRQLSSHLLRLPITLLLLRH